MRTVMIGFWIAVLFPLNTQAQTIPELGFPTPTQTLPSNISFSSFNKEYASDAVLSPKGELFIANSSQVVKYQGQKPQVLGSLKDANIQAFAVSAKGTPVVAYALINPTRNFVAQWDSKNWSPLGSISIKNNYGFEASLSGGRLLQRKNGQWYYITDIESECAPNSCEGTKVFSYDGKTWRSIPTPSGDATVTKSWRAATLDQNDNLFMASETKTNIKPDDQMEVRRNAEFGVYKFDGKKWSLTGKFPSTHESALALEHDAKGNVLLGQVLKDSVLVQQFDGKVWSKLGLLTLKNVPEFNNLDISMTSDAQGSMAVAVTAARDAKFVPTLFTRDAKTKTWASARADKNVTWLRVVSMGDTGRAVWATDKQVFVGNTSLKTNAPQSPTAPIAQSPANKSPIITTFTATPNPALTTDTPQFSWQITDPENDDLTCQLDVDNNGSFEYTIPNCSNSSVQKHKYAKEGLYTARLQVRDSKNASVNQTLTMTVNIPETVVTVNTFEDSQDAAAGDGNCLDNDGKCSLRAAIMEANSDTSQYYKIKLSKGTYNLTIRGDEQEARAGDLNIATNLRIEGVSPEKTRIQVADFGFMTLADNKRVEMLGFTLTGGTNVFQGEGSISMNRVNLEKGKNIGSITNLEVQDGIWSDFCQEAESENQCTGVTGNTASLTNLEIKKSKMTSLFSVNEALNLTNIKITDSYGTVSAATMKIENLNTKNMNGNFTSQSLKMQNSLVVTSNPYNNQEDNDCFLNGNQATITNSQFLGGSSSVCFGSLTFIKSKQMYNKGSIRGETVKIIDSYLFGNFGNGIQASNLELTNSIIRKITGFAITSKNATITNSLIDANGLGIAQYDGNLQLFSSIVSNNRNGGIRLDDSSTAIIKNTIIAKNTAVRGAGIDGGQKISIIHSTIISNRANAEFNTENDQNNQKETAGQGGGFYATGLVELRGVILTDNTTSTNRGPNCAGNPPKSLGYNLIRNTTDCGFVINRNSAGQVTDIVAQDAKLIALPLSKPSSILEPILNVLPDSTSPLLNRIPAAECAGIPEDLKGTKRTGNCDIGAIERQETETPIVNTWLDNAAQIIVLPATKLLKPLEKFGLLINFHKTRRYGTTTYLSVFSFSPDGRTLATVNGGSSGIHILDTSSGQEIKTLKFQDQDSYLCDAVFSPDGHTLATVSGSRNTNDKITQIWDVSSGQEIKRFPDTGCSLAFSPDEKYIATTSNDNTAKLWNISNGQEIKRFQHENRVYKVIFSPDGRYLATSSYGAAQIWDILSGQEIKRFQHDYEVYDVIFSSDGHMLATAGVGGARIWNVLNGQKIKQFQAEKIYQVAFSPDGHTLATSGEWDYIRMKRFWDVSSGQEILSSQVWQEDGDAYTVAFSPDGKLFTSGTSLYGSPDDEAIFNSPNPTALATQQSSTDNLTDLLVPPLFRNSK
jgi:CSLREA domain-containing protein